VTTNRLRLFAATGTFRDGGGEVLVLSSDDELDSVVTVPGNIEEHHAVTGTKDKCRKSLKLTSEQLVLCLLYWPFSVASSKLQMFII